jgi:hypothetical protein
MLSGSWTDHQIELLVYVLRSLDAQKHVYYDTRVCLNDENTKTPFQDELDILIKEKQVEFDAAGRWAFERNLDCFWSWSEVEDKYWVSFMLSIEPDRHITREEYFSKRQELVVAMKENDLSLLWTFKDEESGNCVLYEEVGEHTSDGMNLIYGIQSRVDHEHNLKNYCDVCCDGDEEPLTEIVSILCDLYENKVEHTRLFDAIKADPSWYDIGTHSWYDDQEEVPDRLRTKIQELIGAPV